jgi:hypothetical protein
MVEHLENHIMAKKCESHLVSFSFSYMWVFHRALVLKEKGHQDIRIAVIDTWDIPRNTWVRHAQSMLKGYGIEGKMMMKNLGAAELLVWDELRVSMSVAKLDDMLRAGVLTLLPFYKTLKVDIATSKRQTLIPLPFFEYEPPSGKDLLEE